MSKKWLFLISMIVCLGLVFSACQPAATPTEAPVEEETEPPVEETEPPTEEEETEVSTEEEVAVPEQSDIILNVAAASQTSTTFTYNFNPFTNSFLFPAIPGMYEPLMVINHVQGEIVPWLSTEYEWNEDYTELTLYLREGVLWSDGEDFTSEDVVFTFDLLKTVPGLSGYGLNAVGEGGYVDSVTAPDDYTVVFSFNKVFTPGLYDIINQNIVPEHIWKDVEDPVTFTNLEPVGTGPFTEIVNMQDQVYEVHRNPNYWQPGQPYVKGLRMPAFSGNEASATMLANGEVDWTGQFFPNVEESVLAHNPNAHCWWPTVTSDQLFIVNHEIEPFDDPIVRKAISMSFNRELLIEVAIQGTSSPGDVTGLSDGYAAWKVEDPSELGDWTKFDVDAANAMLDEAGYEKGADGVRTGPDDKRWSFELIMVNGFSDWLAIAPMLKESLESIGFEITINNYDPGQTFGKWMSGDFDMSLFFGIDADSPYTYYRNIMSSETYKPIGENTGFGENFWRAQIPEADEILQAFASTGDIEKQQELAIQLQEIHAEYAPVIPMWHAPTFYCYSDEKVSGWANEDNPFARVMPIGNNPMNEQILQMVNWEPAE